MKTKTIFQKTAVIFAMFVFIVFAFNACSSDDSDDPIPIPIPIAIEPVVVSFTDYNTWRMATMAYPELTNKKWICNRDNVNKANEANEFVADGNELHLFNPITLSSASTGLPFNFYLENKVYNTEIALLNLDEGPGGGFTAEYISIGEIDVLQNDDFEIGVTGTNVYALGIDILNNVAESGEFLDVYALDESGNEYKSTFTDLIDGDNTVFYGVISTTPIKRIFFNEHSGGDDIAVGDFYFAHK